MMDSIAEKLTQWFGSAPFIAFHVAWFFLWILLHFVVGLDPEWRILTLIVSLEAIFLTLFVLRGQNVQNKRFEHDVKRDVRLSKKVLKEVEELRFQQ